MKEIKVLLKIIVSFLAEAATPLTQPNPAAVCSFPELQSFAFLFSLRPFCAQVYGSTPESIAAAGWGQDGVYVSVGRVCVCPPRFQPGGEANPAARMISLCCRGEMCKAAAGL